MTAREIVVALSVVVFFFVIGLFPNLLFEKINPSVGAVLTRQVTATTVVAEVNNE